MVVMIIQPTKFEQLCFIVSTGIVKLYSDCYMLHGILIPDFIKTAGMGEAQLLFDTIQNGRWLCTHVKCGQSETMHTKLRSNPFLTSLAQFS